VRRSRKVISCEPVLLPWFVGIDHQWVNFESRGEVLYGDELEWGEVNRSPALSEGEGPVPDRDFKLAWRESYC
jgi:hypothetical protein